MARRMQDQCCIDVKFWWRQAQARNMLRNSKSDLVDAAEEGANFLANENVSVHDDKLSEGARRKLRVW